MSPEYANPELKQHCLGLTCLKLCPVPSKASVALSCQAHTCTLLRDVVLAVGSGPLCEALVGHPPVRVKRGGVVLTDVGAAFHWPLMSPLASCFPVHHAVGPHSTPDPPPWSKRSHVEHSCMFWIQPFSQYGEHHGETLPHPLCKERMGDECPLRAAPFPPALTCSAFVV